MICLIYPYLLCIEELDRFTLSETINKNVYNACVNILCFYYNDFDGVKSSALSHHNVILLNINDFKKVNSGNNKSVHNSNF